jgi:hypothetical protein
LSLGTLARVARREALWPYARVAVKRRFRRSARPVSLCSMPYRFVVSLEGEGFVVNWGEGFFAVKIYAALSSYKNLYFCKFNSFHQVAAQK